jgi:hypothetical protein
MKPWYALALAMLECEVFTAALTCAQLDPCG